MTHLKESVIAMRNKRREELEAVLNSCTADGEYDVDESGVLTRKVTPLQTFLLIKSIGKTQQIQGRFLLHLDDRITEQNGYHDLLTDHHDQIKNLQAKVTEICSERDETCPVLPLVREAIADLDTHLSEAEKQQLIIETTTATRQKWINEGKAEHDAMREQELFYLKKKWGWIAAYVGMAGVILTALGLILRLVGVFG